MQTSAGQLNRRQFLRAGAGASGLAILGGGLGEGRAASPREPNPFAYQIDHLAKTDPSLVRYREVSRTAVGREGALRVAVGPSDQLFVAAGDAVIGLGAGGAVVSTVTLPADVQCLTFAEDGTLYAGTRDHIEAFDAKGKRLATWDKVEGRPWLTGLSAGENDLFAADAGNRIVHRYDRSGKALTPIGKRDRQRGIDGFVIPSPYFDVELHRDGLLRVTNPGRHRIDIFTVEGDLEFSWGKPSAAIDGFCGCCNPICFALTGQGVYVTGEKGLPRVKLYAEHGEFQGVVAGPESFPESAKIGVRTLGACNSGAGLDVAVDGRARVHVLDHTTNLLQSFEPKPGAAT